MSTWTVNAESTALLRDGVPTFVLADTLWAAFTRTTTEEWLAYLRVRRQQGFNAVLVSILPIAHDQSQSSTSMSPFGENPDGSPDLDSLRADYFTRAGQLAAMAVEEGLTPVLVVLWCNYVPGSWGARLTPDLVLSAGQTSRYLERVVATFAQHRPIFVISGDERFDAPESVVRYHKVLEQLRAAAPGCLTTLHSTPDSELPRVLADSGDLSFYSYQSGHDGDWSDRSWTLAQQYLKQRVRRPIIDLEPCYEGHGFGSGTGRHRSDDVRRASWTAVLAGAGAGLGYAAHGVWSWHRSGDPFNGEGFSGTPFPAQTAMGFRGAWDVALLRQIVEAESLYALESKEELLSDNHSGIRVGGTPDGSVVVVYLPEPFSARIRGSYDGERARGWDLEQRSPVRPRLRGAEGDTIIEQPDFLGDALVVLRR